MAQKKGSLLEEFKKFISRGNVMDMAVGIIIGTAFTAIVYRWSRISSCRSSA